MGSWLSTTQKAPEATGGTRKRSCASAEKNESKRAKIDESGLVLPHLPPELWANTLEYLECSDVMQCTASSPAFLREVLPKVETLFINDKKQLDLRLTQRFKTGCVKSVFIMVYKDMCCSDPPRDGALLAMSVVPFLQQFHRLEYVFLGSLEPARSDDATTTVRKHSTTGVCYRNALEQYTDWSGANEGVFRGLITAFQFNLLPKGLCVEGVFPEHPNAPLCRRRAISPCLECESLCKHCPMSLAWDTASCHNTSQRVEILLRRKGGAEFLRNPKRFLPMLRRILLNAWSQSDSLEEVESFFQDLQLLKNLGCHPTDLSREMLRQCLGFYFLVPRNQRNENLIHELMAVGFDFEVDFEYLPICIRIF